MEYAVIFFLSLHLISGADRAREKNSITSPSFQWHQTSTQSIFDCDFECNCICQWKHDNATNFKWLLARGSTLTSETGPSGDHTTGSQLGHFLYIEASVPAKVNDTARLISPNLIVTNNEQCFRFHYHMFGSDVYRLNIYARINGRLGKALWQKEGDQGDRWLFGRITLRDNIELPVGQTYQLVVEAIVGKSFLGDISIDDLALSQGPCPASSFCDFESSDLCNSVNDPINTVDWVRAQGGTDPSLPAIDVTYGSTHGHFMFLKINGTTRGVNGRLVTPTYTDTSGSCIRWYMFLTNNATLRVRTYAFGLINPNTLYSIHGEQGKQWHLAQATVRRASPYQVVFEGVLNSTLDSIALDKVEIQSGVCTELAACDFERDTCAFQNLKADFNWRRASFDIAISEAPPFDHTTHNRAGFYLWLDRRNTLAGWKARIESELIPVDIRCVSFWYYMNNSVGTQLNVYMRDPRSDYYNQIWSTNQNHGSFWVLQEITVRPNMTVNGANHYKIVYEAVVGSRTGELAIDDLSTKAGPCQSTPPPPIDIHRCLDGTLIPSTKICDFIVDCKGGDDERSCGNCTFEASTDPLCGWTDVSRGIVMWKRGSNGTREGPTFDHTTFGSSGNYIYLTSGNGTLPDAPARFITPVLRQASSTCVLEFWLFMSSFSSNPLHVTLLTGNQTERATLQRFYQTLPNNWTKVSIEIGRVDIPFQISFDSKRAITSGWVAIDDTMILNCHLPTIVSPNQCSAADRFQCARGSCIAKSRTCDLTDDCGDYSDETTRLCSTYQICTFDLSFCEWRHDNSTEFRWELIRGPSPSDETGPYRDHTTGYATGQYAFIEASYPQKPGDKARLISRPFQPKTSQCRMIFYYHMLGEDTGQLNVYVRFYDNGPLVELYGVFGERGNMWIRHELMLNYTIPFQVLIEGIVGVSFLSDIGLDDTVFTPECEPYSLFELPPTTILATAITTTPEPCPLAGQVPCSGTTYCIDQDKICDLTVDCPDGSDEDGCGPCDFEKDLCGWEDISLSYFKWDRVQASDASAASSTAPPYDHTLNTGLGWYMHVDGTTADLLDLAELRSQPLPASNSECEIVFYYWLENNGTSQLELFASTSAIALWRSSSAPVNRWNRASVKVGVNPARWRFYFQVEPNLEFSDGRSHGIALDDISISQCRRNRSQHALDCDFETDFCSWETKDLGEFEWTRISSKTPTSNTGPSGDHTTGTGYYIYIESSLPQAPGDRALLTSPLIPPTASSCLVFYYHMFGQDIHLLNVILQTTGSNRTLFTRTEHQGVIWRKGQVDYQSTLSHKIVFEGIVGKGWEGDIALDDIALSLGHCPQMDQCTFEDEECTGWERGPDGDFSWSRGRTGSTSSAIPMIDHTLSSAAGYFLFIDPTGRLPGEEAHLLTARYSGIQARCLQLWYHLHGAKQGILEIRQKPEIGGTKTIWNKTTGQDDFWRPARMTIPELLGMGTYRILIIGVVGTTPTRYLAIDDVSTTDGECLPSDVCTFQEDLCSWINGQNGLVDDFDWLRHSGDTPSYGTGPTVDHTLGTPEGVYAYIEASDSFPQGSKAWLISEYNDAGRTCLVFWYHMYGIHIGSLNIYTRIGTANPRLEWSLSGERGDQWQKGVVNVNMSAEFYFIIEGVRTAGYLGDIAIDDLLITSDFTCEMSLETTISSITFSTSVPLFTSSVTNPPTMISHITSPTTASSPPPSVTGSPSTMVSHTSLPTIASTAVVSAVTSTSAAATVQTDSSITTPKTASAIITSEKETLMTSKRSTEHPTTQTISVTLNCLSSPCYNGGTCSSHPTEPHRFTCSCTSDFTGNQCENEKPSKSNHLGIILGSVFGGVALVAIIVVGLVFVRPRLCP